MGKLSFSLLINTRMGEEGAVVTLEQYYHRVSLKKSRQPYEDHTK